MTLEKEARPSRQEEIAPPSIISIAIIPDYPAIGNPKDCAAALGIPERGVRELCRTGRLRAFKCGALWKIPKAWLLEFIENGGCLGQRDANEQGGGAPCRAR